VKLREVRRLALALPEATEEPHFDLDSFRVNGKIFATVAPDGSFMNVFVDDDQREIMVRVDDAAYETRKWGRIGYLHVRLPLATARDVQTLLRASWERKAPKKLLARLEENGKGSARQRRLRQRHETD
jgi:hypothetical protein